MPVGTFVSVGNGRESFTRLLDAVAAAQADGALPEPVVVQRGHSPFENPHIVSYAFLDPVRFKALMSEAALVVLHAGAGSAIVAIEAGKVPVLMARRASLGEVSDDHQLDLATDLARRGRAVVIEAPEEMAEAAELAQAQQQVRTGGTVVPPLIDEVRSYLAHRASTSHAATPLPGIAPLTPASSMLAFIRRLAVILRNRPALGLAVLRLIPDVRVTIQIARIGPFCIRLRRNRSFWLRSPLTHEQYPLAMLKALIKPGDVVYDVGANIGMYARFIVQEFGAGTLVAFEPMSENREMLIRNIHLGGLDHRVTVLPYALSNENGTASLQVDDMQTGSAALDAVTHGEAAAGRAALGLAPKVEIVETRCLDDVIQQARLPTPNVIKVDIEGAELLMLRGAREVLATHRPRLMIETHGPDLSRGAAEVLFELGYSISGKVSTRLFGYEHGPVAPEQLGGIDDIYDLHFIVASPDASDLPATYEPYEA